MLGNLLSTASLTKISECNPIHAKETDANTESPAPVCDQFPQVTAASEHINTESPAACHAGDHLIPLPDSFHREQLNAHSNDTTDTAYHSEDRRKTSLTDSLQQKFVPHDTNVQAEVTFDIVDQTLTLHPDSSHQDPSTKDQAVAIPGQITSVSTSAAPSATYLPHQIMLHYNDKLIIALSLDPQGIAEILLAKGLIPENTEAQMRQCSTPHEKAAILVTTVRQRIKIAPKRYNEFVDILSKHEWMKDIVELLHSHSPKQLRKDTGVQATSTGDHSSPGKVNESSDEVSSNGENSAYHELNSDDEAELEAQLIISADIMRKKFASLLVNVVNSFQHQEIDPRKVATTVLALTEYDDPAVGKPLLEREKQDLKKAQSIDDTFDIIRPHMTFFNYEILEFLIEQMGSPSDRDSLQKFLQEFRIFCRRSIFEISPSVLGHSAKKAINQQKFCMKITRQFKAALLVQCTKQSEPHSQATESTQLSSSAENRERISAPELGISLEDAKHIQRKVASVLKLKVSSIYLDSASSGSTILTFLIPSNISLAGLDSDRDIIALSSNGIEILCGPPGKPEPKELTSNGLVVQWSQPEYGCRS